MNDCPMLFSEESCRRMSMVRVCDCGADAWNAKIDEVLK